METNENTQPTAATQTETMQPVAAETNEIQPVIAETEQQQVIAEQTVTKQPVASEIEGYDPISKEEEEWVEIEYQKLELRKKHEKAARLINELESRIRMSDPKEPEPLVLSKSPEEQQLPATTEPEGALEEVTIETVPGTVQFEQNHFKIEECIQKLLIQSVKPTPLNISKITGMSRNTIYKHLKTIKTQAPKDDVDYMMVNAMKGSVLMGILRGAMMGKDQALRLYSKIFGLTDMNNNSNKDRISIKNSNIQCNNYHITPEMLNKLSPEKQKELENLLLELTNNQ